MLKSASKASPVSISKEALLSAAERFIHSVSGTHTLVRTEALTSPDFGSSDLAFAGQDRRSMIVAKAHQGGNFAEAIMAAVAYHFWLTECIRLSGRIVGHPIVLDTYFFSPDIPSDDSFLLKMFLEVPRFFMVRYEVLDIEGELVPVSRFDLVEGKRLSDDGTSETASAATGDRTGEIGRSSLADLSLLEIEEFNRLKAVHLVGKDKK